MFEQNIELKQVNINVFDIRVVSSEVQKLFNKHNRWCNIKITKPEVKGTVEQNRAAHALLTEYYKTGFHSAPEGYTLAEFKVFMKLQYGPIFKLYVDGKDIIVPKSWSDYSKQERHDFIDGLISEIHQSNAYNHSQKIQEIITGMELEK